MNLPWIRGFLHNLEPQGHFLDKYKSKAEKTWWGGVGERGVGGLGGRGHWTHPQNTLFLCSVPNS